MDKAQQQELVGLTSHDVSTVKNQGETKMNAVDQLHFSFYSVQDPSP